MRNPILFESCFQTDADGVSNPRVSLGPLWINPAFIEWARPIPDSERSTISVGGRIFSIAVPFVALCRVLDDALAGITRNTTPGHGTRADIGPR